MMKKYAFIFLLLAFLLPAAVLADGRAEDVSAKCEYVTSFKASGFYKQMTDESTKTADTHREFKAGASVSLSWKENTGVSFIYLQWLTPPKSYTLAEYGADGALLTETSHTDNYLFNEVLYLREDAAKAVITAGEDGMTLVTLKVFGPGEPPEEYHPFAPAPEKLDFLIIAMHPDDDTLFMGGITPTLTDKGLTGNIMYLGTRIRLRCDEALKGAWIMGLRVQPVLAGYPDIPNNYYNKWQHTFKVDDIARDLVRYFRQYRPELVFSHDPDGEYGHWQHKRLSEAVQRAVRLCADASYDPESAAEFGVWQVKKCYLHIYKENRISVDMQKPLASFGGRTALSIAREAYAQHVSQHNGNHELTNKGIYSIEDFGLYYSAVGADIKKDDFLENIDVRTLTCYVEPTPAPTQEPTPTPIPTLVPTDTPEPGISITFTEKATEAPATAVPVTEAPAPTAAPAATPVPEPVNKPAAAEFPSWLSTVITVLFVILGFSAGTLIARLLRRRR